MDYAKNYFNTTSLAQRIREGAAQGKKVKAAGGLAARTTPEPLPGDPNFQMVAANYINDLKDLFPVVEKKATNAEVQNYLDTVEAEDYVNTQTENLNAPSASTEGHVDNSFVSKLIRSESSGNPNAIHKTKEGKIYGGLIQIGESRLEDYNNANKANVNMADMLGDSKLQQSIINWHLKDLNNLAEKLAAKTGLDVTGLVAVGHLGGRTGMANFAATGGKYNKEDELGTSLMDYYTRFKNK